MAVWGPGMPKYGREGKPLRRKRTVKSVKASCDREWSILVRSRAGFKCERCGATPQQSQLHAHHVYGRNNHRLRFEPRNGVCLCARCHRWTHDNPLAYASWFLEHREDDDAFLQAESLKGLVKRDLNDYLELEKILRNSKEDG